MRTSLNLFMLLALLFVGCKSETEHGLTVTEPNINISFEGDTVDLTVKTNKPWTTMQDADWFSLSSNSGEKSKILILSIEPNIGAERTGYIKISSGGKTQQVKIYQQGRKEGIELKYRIPVVFHVLYNDPDDETQNIPYKQIVNTLKKANELFASAGSGSADLGIEFILADRDPQGNLLEEKGVSRVRWHEAKINAPKFMAENRPEYLALIWDPNKYVNIMLYNFQNPSILGISTFPLVPMNHPMKHLEISPKPTLKAEEIDRVRCVSINSLHMDKVNNPDKGVNHTGDLEVGPTLAHELGHYFGLRHTFSERSNLLIDCQDTDECEDTPSYDKQQYDQYVHYIFQKLANDETFKKDFDYTTLFERQACYGDKFISRNIMDYDFCHKNLFTANQKEIVRHVLTYSPYIPGPKIVDAEVRHAISLKEHPLPHSVSNCPESVIVKYSQR